MRPGRPLTILALAAALLTLLWLLAPGEVDPVESARESARAAEAEHGEESVEVASALDRLVESLYGAGLATAPETVEHARRAVAIKEARLGGDAAALAYSLGNLGAVLHARGDFGGAIDATTRSLDIIRGQADGDALALWEKLNNLAYFRAESGDFNAARLHFDEALEVLRERPPGEHLAETQNNYALLLHESGDYPTARRLFEEALRFWEGRDDAKLVYVLNNVGRLLHDQGELPLARERLERARTLVEGLAPPLPAARAMVLNNLGYLLHDLGELEAAAGLYEEARRLREETLGADHPQLAWTLGNLALLHFERRDEAAAEALLGRALDIRTRSLGREHPLVFHSLSYLAALRLHQEAMDEALELALEAEEIRRSGMRLEVQVLAERQALLRRSLDVFKLDATSLDVSLSVAALAAARARPLPAPRIVAIWDDVIRSRGLVLDEVARRHRSALRADDPEVRRLFEAVHAARQRMANLWVRTGAGERFRQAEVEKEKAEEALARAGWVERGTAGREVGWEEVGEALRQLPAGSLLVAFVRYERLAPERIAREAPIPSYLALRYGSGGEAPAIVPLGPAAEIDALIEAWSRSILRGVRAAVGDARPAMTEYREVSSALRARIWDPLLADREGTSPVFVVPDGALHRVSLASLAAGDDGFLVEGRPIHYLNTERDLPLFVAEPLEETARGSGLLALARPRFESRSSAHGAAANPCLTSFEDLPATESEVGEILSIVRAASRAEERPESADPLLLVREDADEGSFKRLAPGRRYLHLATHGFYLDAECAQRRAAARVRGLGAATASSARTRRADDNPLLLSGIALAGANRGAPGSDEDGILTAEEVVSMDLSGVDWAVLSACKTGVGAIHTGEGIFGLRRAFRIAGARTLISSLWPVEDEATRRWMVALYRARFEAGLGTAESVRRASLAVLADGRRDGRTAHPFFWAAFLAAGDWR